MIVRVPAHFAEDAPFDVTAEGGSGAATVFGVIVRLVELGTVAHTSVVLDVLQPLDSSLRDGVTQRAPNDLQSLCNVAM